MDLIKNLGDRIEARVRRETEKAFRQSVDEALAPLRRFCGKLHSERTALDPVGLDGLELLVTLPRCDAKVTVEECLDALRAALADGEGKGWVENRAVEAAVQRMVEQITRATGE